MRGLFLFLFLSGVFFVSSGQTITVGGDYNYPPFSYIDTEGKAAGHDIEILNELSKITGLTFNFQLERWDSVLGRLEKGKVDLAVGMIYSEERNKIFDFSVPLVNEYYTVFARKDLEIKDISDLNDKKLVILSGDLVNEKFLKPQGLLNHYFAIGSLPKAILFIEAGVYDYVIAPYSLGMEIIKRNHCRNVEVKGAPVFPCTYCFAVKGGNTELLARINKGIEELKEKGKLDEINKKWIRHTPSNGVYKTIFYYTFFGLLIVIILFVTVLLWWFSLKKTIKHKTLQIRNAEALYRNIFDATNDALFLVKLNGEIVDANPEAYSLFGYDKNEIIGAESQLFFADESKRDLKEFFENVQKQCNFHKQSINRKKDGTLFDVSVKGVCLEFKGEKHLLASVRDISESVKTHEELKRAKEEAESANTLKSVFFSNISHEIKNPMNAIYGFVNLLFQTRLSRTQHNYINKINSCLKVLLELINNSLDLSKIESGSFTFEHKKFNIVEDVFQYVNDIIVYRAEGKDMALCYDIDPQLPVYYFGDPVRLSQIIVNLCSNSLKYTTSGFIKISLRLHGEEQTAKHGRIKLIFSVHDTGSGISDKMKEKIFQRFAHSKNPDGGFGESNGLGLVISRELVSKMNGEIWFTSEKSNGCDFYFTAELDTPTTNESIQTKYQLPKTINALLVSEENEETLFLISILQTMNIKTGLALPGTSLTGINLSFTPEVILFDDSADQHTIENIREQFPGLPSILMTGKKAKRDQSVKIDSYNDLIEKPLLFSRLYRNFLKFQQSDEIPVKLDTLRSDLSGISILLAEDDLFNAEMLEDLFVLYGATVVHAENGNKAIEYLEKNHQVDIVLMDLKMPELGGLEAIKVIRSIPHCRLLPVIAFSANGMESEKQKCLESGFNDYADKPIESEMLFHKIIMLTRIKKQCGLLAFENGMKIFGNNKEMLMKSYDRFYHLHQDLPGKLKNMFQEKQWRSIAQSAHKLFNAASMIGASALAGKAKSIEKRVKLNQNIPEKIMEEFLSCLNEVLSGLKILLSH